MWSAVQVKKISFNPQQRDEKKPCRLDNKKQKKKTEIMKKEKMRILNLGIVEIENLNF